MDSVLAGTEGSITYDRGSDGVVIPGSYRNRHEAVNGSTVQLTLDDDIQFYVQQQVQLAKNASGARNVSAVVLDAKTGEVLAMANDNTFDPSQDIGRQADRQIGNLPVTSPFEPGSVNKIVAAAMRSQQRAASTGAAGSGATGMFCATLSASRRGLTTSSMPLPR